jgi:hypothetical protein
MQDMAARIFIFFVFALYAAMTLVFVIAGVRKWIWSPLARKIVPGRSESNYRRVKSTSREGSPS